MLRPSWSLLSSHLWEVLSSCPMNTFLIFWGRLNETRLDPLLLPWIKTVYLSICLSISLSPYFLKWQMYLQNVIYLPVAPANRARLFSGVLVPNGSSSSKPFLDTRNKCPKSWPKQCVLLCGFPALEGWVSPFGRGKTGILGGVYLMKSSVCPIQRLNEIPC